MKTLILSLILLFSANSHADNYMCDCKTDFQKGVYEQNSRLHNAYKRTDGGYLKIGNDAEFLEGTNEDEVVILIHGFIASPYEVKELAQEINRNGYSVYMPLLYGFGGSGDVANTGKLDIWRQQISSAVKELSHCYKRISIGGISLGAALATDYYLRTKDPKISSLVLLSPYFDVSVAATKLLAGPLSNVVGSLDILTLKTISRSDDLIEIAKNSNFYSTIMPFKTLTEIFRLSNELLNKKASAIHDVPVFVAYSEHDTTIDLNQAVQLPKKHFKSVSEYKIAENLKVPHQITYRSSNPKFHEMSLKIKSFIMINNIKFRITH